MLILATTMCILAFDVFHSTAKSLSKSGKARQGVSVYEFCIFHHVHKKCHNRTETLYKISIKTTQTMKVKSELEK